MNGNGRRPRCSVGRSLNRRRRGPTELGTATLNTTTRTRQALRLRRFYANRPQPAKLSSQIHDAEDYPLQSALLPGTGFGPDLNP